MLTDRQGRYLSCGTDGGLFLTEGIAEDDLSLWQAVPAEGGYNLLSAGAADSQALEYYGGKITTYRYANSGYYLFNFL